MPQDSAFRHYLCEKCGLKVRAFLDRKDYPVGITPSAARMREIRITRHNRVPRSNYTIKPSDVK